MATNTLDLLKSKRKTLRRFATMSLQHAATTLADPNVTLVGLRKTKAHLKAKFEELHAVDQQILELLTTDDDIDKELTDCETQYNGKYIDCDVDLDTKIDQLEKSNVITTTTLNAGAATFSPTTMNMTTVKLPKFDAKKYSGDPLQWNDFWGGFELNVDKNPQLTSKAKLSYLKSFLEGEAAKVTCNLPYTNNGYNDAKNLLIERYGRDDVLLNAHLMAIRRITPIRRIQDVSGLKKLYDECESHIRGLATAKMSQDAISAVVCPIIMGSIPNSVAVEYSKRCPTGIFKTDELLTVIRNEITHRAKVENYSEMQTTRPVNNDDKIKTKTETKRSHDRRSATVMSVKLFSCVFCQNDEHKSEDCNKTIAQKKEAIKEQHRCFRCTKPNHSSRDCRSTVKCDKCKYRHVTMMCDGAMVKQTTAQVNPVRIVNAVKAFAFNEVMPTLLTYLHCEIKKKLVKCLLDTGSNKTFIHAEIARELKLVSNGEVTLNIATFGQKETQEATRKRFNVNLRTTNDDQKEISFEALETTYVTSPIQNKMTAKLQQKLIRKGISLSDFNNNVDSSVSLLIGTDIMPRMLTGKSVKVDDEIYALETIFGWTLFGASGRDKNTKVNAARILQCYAEENDDTLKRFWELDAIGIQHESRVEDDTQENTTHVKLKEDLKQVDGLYEVGLPWIVPKAELNNNLKVAEPRYWNLIRKLKANPGLLASYHEIFNEQISEGIIRDVDDPNNEECYYMPHRPVIKENRTTTKVRIVFDASAKAKNELSLNNCLDKGPNPLPELINIVMFFREWLIALTSDIKGAFLQLRVKPDDQHYLRFLWVQPEWSGQGRIKIRKMQQTRVIFGANSSPYLLNGTICCHLEKIKDERKETAKIIAKRFYVDDLTTSVKTVEEATKIFIESRSIMAEAHMDLRKWCTNSEELRKTFVPKIPEDTLLIDETKGTNKVLGLKWNFIHDKLGIEVGETLKVESSNKTKRMVIQTVAKVYDPLGILSPFVVVGKILFQEIWKQNIGWDQNLPEEVRVEWERWESQLPQIAAITIDRSFSKKFDAGSRRELHFFCDASPKAYGVVVYMVTRHEETIETALVMSKARVAPLKVLIIPKLELMGALLLSRLYAKLKCGFPTCHQLYILIGF